MPELKSVTPEGLKVFVHLGLVNASEARAASGANYTIDCPFCGAGGFGVALVEKVKPNITVAPGMWNCFKCGENGNTASLLQKVYALAKQSSSRAELEKLSADRGLPVEILEEYGIVPALYTSQYWVPMFNEANILTNIYRYDPDLKAMKSPFSFMGCPGVGVGLYNVQSLYVPPPGCKLTAKELAIKRPTYPVRVAEGHWDTIALDHLLREKGERSTCDIVGCPGATSWQAHWFRYVDRRPLEMWFDYDPPRQINDRVVQAGWDGMQRTVKLAKASVEYRPSSIKMMEWQVGNDSGSNPYQFSPEKKSDIRDVWLHYQDAAAAVDYLSARLIDVDLESDEEIAPVTCTSFRDLDMTYRRHLHWTQLTSDALVIAMAVTISVRIKGPLLWMYLIGPSGCGKSTICDSISADKVHVKRLNQFTGFHSGYKTGEKDRPDVSLISKLPGKALVVPDFTSVLAMSPMMQEKIYGELRNIYDGISSMHYASDVDREYTKITFPIVAGVTHEIHGLRKSALGERFLKVDMTDQSQRRNIISRNIQNVLGSAIGSLADNNSFDAVDELNPFMREIKANTLGFLQHMFRKIGGGVKITFPDWFATKLEALAMIVAASRAEAKRNSGPDRDLVYRPVQEIGSHPAGQLAKLSVALCVVLDCDPNEEILRLVQKVAIDTSYGFSLDIIRALGQNPDGLTVEQIASKTRLAPTSVRKICDDLREMEIVYRKYHETASGAVGREAHILHLSTQLQTCWEEIYGKPAPKPVTSVQPARRSLSKPQVPQVQ